MCVSRALCVTRYTPLTIRSPVHLRALRADQPIRTDVHLRQPVGRRTGQDHGPASETAEPRPEIDFRSTVYACIIHTCHYKSIVSSSLGVFSAFQDRSRQILPIPGRGDVSSIICPYVHLVFDAPSLSNGIFLHRSLERIGSFSVFVHQVGLSWYSYSSFTITLAKKARE